MIHESITLIYVLAGHDVRFLEKNFGTGTNYFSRIRRKIFFHVHTTTQQDGHSHKKAKYGCPL